MEIDVTQYLVTSDDGTQTFNQEAFQKDVQKHIDSAVSKGVNVGIENNKKKIQNAEEKYIKQIEELNMRYNRSECKALFSNELFSDKERDMLLDSLVDGNLEESQKRVNALVSERTSFAEGYKKKILESLQAKTPTPSNGPVSAPTPTPSAEKSFQEQSEEIKKYYR